MAYNIKDYFVEVSAGNVGTDAGDIVIEDSTGLTKIPTTGLKIRGK